MTEKVISSDYRERMEDPTLSLYEKLYGKTEKDVRDNLLKIMAEHGVARIEATYSGGHDEGGIQDLTMYGVHDNPIELDVNWQHPLWQACDEVMSTKYFSWATDFSIDGRLHVNLVERRIWTEGQEEQWAEDKQPIDWKW